MFAALVLAASLTTTLDAAVEQGMRDVGVPSVAVAVVQDDKVVHRRVYGAPADARFYLASAPKPMTALTAKLLSHDKKLDLDAPLSTTLPQLKLPPPLDTSRMSVRDLLTHRLGFDNDGVGWRASYSGDWTDEKMFALLERYTTVTPRQFRYDNLGYMLTSYAAERAAGEPWWSLLQTRLFTPLGMTRTSNEPCIPTKTLQTMNRGSGGLCSSIEDMTRWLRVNMNQGVLDGKRIFPLVVMREAQAPQINLDRKFGRFQRYAYALGWYHADYEGDWMIHHFGSYPGSWAHVSWLPDRKIGVVVLANQYSPFADAVATLAYDTLIGRADAKQRFDADVQGIRDSLAARPDQIAKMEKRIFDEAKDSDRALSSYTGVYTEDEIGTMTVREENGALHATVGDRSGPLRRVRGDAFVVSFYKDDAPDRVTFTSDGLVFRNKTFARKP